MWCATTKRANKASPPTVSRRETGFPRIVEKKPFTVPSGSAIRSCLCEPVSGAGETPFSVKPRSDNQSLQLAFLEQMVEPWHDGLVRHRPRHFDIRIELGRSMHGLKARLLSRPHAHEHGGPSTEDASELRQRSDAIRLDREMMQDRNAQARVERCISERQFRRFAADPIDAEGIFRSTFTGVPD